MPHDVARRLRDGHPFIFSEALRGRTLPFATGQEVTVVDADGKFVGNAICDAKGTPPLRMVSRSPGSALTAQAVRARLEQCLVLRRQLLDLGPLSCYRLANADSEGLPGVTIDHYAEYVLMCFYSEAAERLREPLVEGLNELLRPKGIYLQRRFGPATPGHPRPGPELCFGSAAPPEVVVAEGRTRFVVDVSSPTGTGIYPDMRTGREAVARLAAGRRVLNCFSYAGAFSVVAALHGATSVVSVDSAGRAHSRARRSFGENRIDSGDPRYEFVTGDTFAVLARFAERQRRFDLVILDPPTFSSGKGSRTFTALKDYAELTAAAAEVTEPGGFILAASNAAKLPAADLERSIGRGASMAGREALLVQQLPQPPDYPVLPSFPEGLYLKVFLARVS